MLQISIAWSEHGYVGVENRIATYTTKAILNEDATQKTDLACCSNSDLPNLLLPL